MKNLTTPQAILHGFGLVALAIETGMRRSEILKLRWCDVDLENGFSSLFDTMNEILAKKQKKRFEY